MEKMMFNIVEMREDSIKVFDNRTESFTVIARYEDNDGVYFANHNNEKQYASDTETYKEETSVSPKPPVHSNKKAQYTFDVVTANKWGEPSKHYSKTFKADDCANAKQKLYNHYKNVYDIELTGAIDKYGNDIFSEMHWNNK